LFYEEIRSNRLLGSKVLVLNLMKPIPLAKADATQRAGQQALIFAAEPSEISLWLFRCGSVRD